PAPRKQRHCSDEGQTNGPADRPVNVRRHQQQHEVQAGGEEVTVLVVEFVEHDAWGNLLGLAQTANHPVASRHPSLKRRGEKTLFPLLPEEGCLRSRQGGGSLRCEATKPRTACARRHRSSPRRRTAASAAAGSRTCRRSVRRGTARCGRY